MKPGGSRRRAALSKGEQTLSARHERPTAEIPCLNCLGRCSSEPPITTMLGDAHRVGGNFGICVRT